MFYYISGSLTLLTPTFAVVEAGGVGFKLTVSGNTFQTLSPAASKKEIVKLYTELAVREDGMELFGFADEEEMNTFKLLITVSGVGPKAAMAVLTAFTPAKFALAVCTEDRKAIAKANGIGPKTAARIILELRDKLMKETSIDDDLSTAMLDHSAEAAGAPARGKLSEAMDALLVLGYTRGEAQNALKTIDTQALSIEDIIKEALKKLMKN